MPSITIELPGGGILALELQTLRWEIDKGNDEATFQAFFHANHVASEYQYSPADGYPGYLLAAITVKEIGGKVVADECPDIPPGAIP